MVGFVAQVAAAVWALVVASRIRQQAPRAAALLSAAAIVELVWRAIYLMRILGSTALFDAGLEIVLDVVAVLDSFERAVVIVLAAMAVRARLH